MFEEDRLCVLMRTKDQIWLNVLPSHNLYKVKTLDQRHWLMFKCTVTHLFGHRRPYFLEGVIKVLFADPDVCNRANGECMTCKQR